MHSRVGTLRVIQQPSIHNELFSAKCTAPWWVNRLQLCWRKDQTDSRMHVQLSALPIHHVKTEARAVKVRFWIWLRDCVKAAVQMLLAGDNSSGHPLTPPRYEGGAGERAHEAGREMRIGGFWFSAVIAALQDWRLLVRRDWRGFRMFDKKDDDSTKPILSISPSRSAQTPCVCSHQYKSGGRRKSQSRGGGP